MESKHRKILAVDDNQDNLVTIRAFARETFPEFEVLTATGTREGVTLARDENPDVILLDILMPEMDGFETCLALKADEALRDIPVVFVTAFKADKKNHICALEVGADGFLTKPIDESELAAQIKAMVKIKDARVKGRDGKLLLAKMVEERTDYLEKELAERKRAEMALLESEQRFRTIFESAPLGIALIDSLSGHILEVNPRFAEIAGRSREQMAAIIWMSITHPDDVRADLDNIELMNAGKIPGFTMQKRYVRPDNSIVWINMTVAPMAVENRGQPRHLCMIEDITEMRTFETRLRQSEKMDAIGQLAGGIAHDFNNVLSGIVGYTDMSLNKAEKGSVLEKNLRIVLKSADRAKMLVRQILTFSRQGSQTKTITAVQPIIKEVMELLGASIPSSVTIESDVQEDTKPVLADSTQIHEMILNLATNAVYAMKRKGTLTVRFYTEKTTLNTNCRLGMLPPGEYAVIEVKDTGCGMDAQILDRAFDPFFTTKPVDEGTGMGLSVVLGVVQSHNGDLQVESDLGKGTTFRIFLPVTIEAKPVENDTESPICRGRNERVLFVDDEKILVNLAKDQLSGLGYSVTCMSNSKKALNFISTNSADIDVVVTDQTMPGLSGAELATAALEIRGDLPIVLCTGYSSEINQEQAEAIGIKRLVFKPLRIRELAKVLRDVIDNCKNEAPQG